MSSGRCASAFTRLNSALRPSAYAPVRAARSAGTSQASSPPIIPAEKTADIPRTFQSVGVEHEFYVRFFQQEAHPAFRVAAAHSHTYRKGSGFARKLIRRGAVEHYAAVLGRKRKHRGITHDRIESLRQKIGDRKHGCPRARTHSRLSEQSENLRRAFRGEPRRTDEIRAAAHDHAPAETALVPFLRTERQGELQAREVIVQNIGFIAHIGLYYVFLTLKLPFCAFSARIRIVSPRLRRRDCLTFFRFAVLRGAEKTPAAALTVSLTLCRRIHRKARPPRR